MNRNTGRRSAMQRRSEDESHRTEAIGRFAEWQRSRRRHHVVGLPGSVLVERECRRTAERVAAFCAEQEDGLVRFIALLQCEDEAMRRWVAETPSRRLRAIWKAPRDRREILANARSIRPVALADLIYA